MNGTHAAKLREGEGWEICNYMVVTVLSTGGSLYWWFCLLMVLSTDGSVY